MVSPLVPEGKGSRPPHHMYVVSRLQLIRRTEPLFPPDLTERAMRPLLARFSRRAAAVIGGGGTAPCAPAAPAAPAAPRRFHTLGLADDALRAVGDLGIDPRGGATAAQRRAIEHSLMGRDVAIFTGTGSGKTVSYLLPLVSRLKADEDHRMAAAGREEVVSFAAELPPPSQFRPEPRRPRAVVLAPSRELCGQIADVAKIMAHNCKLRVVGLDGSRSMKQQRRALERGVDIVVATPGRLQRHRENEDLFLSRVLCLVLDEADVLVSKEFDGDAMRIVQSLRARDGSDKRSARRGDDAERCLYTLASATSSPALRNVMRTHFPSMVSVEDGPGGRGGSKRSDAARRLKSTRKEGFVQVLARSKYEALLDAVRSGKFAGRGRRRPSPSGHGDDERNHDDNDGRHDDGAVSHHLIEPTLVFCNSVASCRAAEHFLRESGYHTCGYHSEMPSALRTENFNAFKEGNTELMVCTDIAARGLDLRQVRHVINLDFPRNSEWYQHRAGRTARAGDSGRVTSLFTKQEAGAAKSAQAGEEYDSADPRARSNPVRDPSRKAGVRPQANKSVRSPSAPRPSAPRPRRGMKPSTQGKSRTGNRRRKVIFSNNSRT